MTTALSVIVVRQIMNKPSNYLTNFTRSKRNLSRLGLLVLAVLMTLGAAASPAGATPTVQVVLPPTPSGTEPGGEMFLQATVTGSGSAAMTFYLGETPSHNGNDVAIGSTTAASGTVGVAGSVPQEVAPGFYYLQACIGSNCVASLGTIQIIGQALSAVDQSTDTSVLADPPRARSISPKRLPAWRWAVRFLVRSHRTASIRATAFGSRLNSKSRQRGTAWPCGTAQRPILILTW